MRVAGRQVYSAGAEVLWSVLHDPFALERLLPGCESIEATAADQFSVTLSLRVGQSVERLSGVFYLDSATPFLEFSFRAEGESANGGIVSHGRVYLEEEKEGATAVGYEADIEVNGQIATVSPRLLETTARAFGRRCLESLDGQVALRTRVYTTSIFPLEVAQSRPPAVAIHQLALFRRVVAFVMMLLAAVFLWRGMDRRRTSRVIRQVAAGLEPSPAAEPRNETGMSGRNKA